jgi:hypothetical protein
MGKPRRQFATLRTHLPRSDRLVPVAALVCEILGLGTVAVDLLPVRRQASTSPFTNVTWSAISDDAIRRTENHLDHPRSAIIRFVLEMARAGLSPLGQVLVQFMMVWQR